MPVCRYRIAVAALALASSAAGCAPDGGGYDARVRELEERLTPGLHSLMVDLGMRHASLWFAGDAGNWPLADYMVHEVEELIGEIEELHPVYRDIQVAALLGEMTMPAVESLEAAVDAGDPAAFVDAYDRFTAACNHCHTASGRAAIVIQRPSAPPQTNLRFEP
jgi:cytochrome c553